MGFEINSISSFCGYDTDILESLSRNRELVKLSAPAAVSALPAVAESRVFRPPVCLSMTLECDLSSVSKS